MSKLKDEATIYDDIDYSDLVQEKEVGTETIYDDIDYSDLLPKPMEDALNVYDESKVVAEQPKTELQSEPEPEKKRETKSIPDEGYSTIFEGLDPGVQASGTVEELKIPEKPEKVELGKKAEFPADPMDDIKRMYGEIDIIGKLLKSTSEAVTQSKKELDSQLASLTKKSESVDNYNREAVNSYNNELDAYGLKVDEYNEGILTVGGFAEQFKTKREDLATYLDQVTQTGREGLIKRGLSPEVAREQAIKGFLGAVPRRIEEPPPISMEEYNKPLINRPEFFDTPIGEVAGSAVQGVTGLGESIAGIGEAIGSATGFNALEALSKGTGDAISRFTRSVAPDDPDFAQQLVSGIMSMVTFGVIGKGLAGTVGLISKLKKAGQISEKASKWIMLAGMSGTEALTEAGGVYREARASGMSKEEAQNSALYTGLANAILIPVTEKLGFLADNGPSIKKALVSFFMEGTQEAGQDVISSLAQGKKVDAESAIVSAMIGGIIGSGASLVEFRSAKEQYGQAIADTINKHFANNKKKSFSPQDADAVVLELLKPGTESMYINKPSGQSEDQFNRTDDYEIDPSQVRDDGFTDFREFEPDGKAFAEQPKESEPLTADPQSRAAVGVAEKRVKPKLGGNELIDEKIITDAIEKVRDPEQAKRLESLYNEVLSHNKNLREKSNKKEPTHEVDTIDKAQSEDKEAQNRLKNYGKVEGNNFTNKRDEELYNSLGGKAREIISLFRRKGVASDKVSKKIRSLSSSGDHATVESQKLLNKFAAEDALADESSTPIQRATARIALEDKSPYNGAMVSDNQRDLSIDAEYSVADNDYTRKLKKYYAEEKSNKQSKQPEVKEEPKPEVKPKKAISLKVKNDMVFPDFIGVMDNLDEEQFTLEQEVTDKIDALKREKSEIKGTGSKEKKGIIDEKIVKLEKRLSDIGSNSLSKFQKVYDKVAVIIDEKLKGLGLTNSLEGDARKEYISDIIGRLVDQPGKTFHWESKHSLEQAVESEIKISDIYEESKNEGKSNTELESVPESEKGETLSDKEKSIISKEKVLKTKSELAESEVEKEAVIEEIDQAVEQIDELIDEIDTELEEKFTTTELPLEEITVDTKKFQNRNTSFSQESVDRIKSGFAWSKFSPIVVWKDSETGTIYLLAGHSRLQAFKEMSKADEKFKTIPVTFSEATTLEDAQKFAKQESNMLGTKETDTERAKVYSDMRKDGETKKSIEDRAKELEGKNANNIINLSYLSPNGKTVGAVKSLSNASVADKNTANGIADWIGEARKKFTELTDSHEDELYDYLMDGNNFSTIRNKQNFLSSIEGIVDDLLGFDSSKSLNLGKKVGGVVERQYREEIASIKEKLKLANKALKKKQIELAEKNVPPENLTTILKPYNDDVIYYQRKLIEIEKKSDDVRQMVDDQLGMFEEKEDQGAKIEKIEKASPRTEAVGILSGGNVSQVEKAGFEFVKGDLESGSDAYYDLVGIIAGNASQLVGSGVTIRKVETKKLSREEEKSKLAKSRSAKISKPEEREKKITKKRDELDDLLDDYIDGMGDLNSGVDPVQLAKGVRIVAKYVELGIYKFTDIAKSVYERKGEDILRRMWKGLKGAYAEFRENASDKDYEKMDQNTRSIKIEDVIHSNKAEQEQVEPEPSKAEISSNEKLVNMIYATLKAGGIKNNPALLKLADQAYGGTTAQGKYQTQDAYNALEAAINKYISELDILENSEAISILEEILNKIPTQTNRNDDKQLLQQFSTPPTLSHLAAKLLNVDKTDIILEPSAGTGNLIAQLQGHVAKIYANEIDPKRQALLKFLGFETSGVDGEFLDSVLDDKIQPTKIIMNPPFSSTGGRTKNNTKFGYAHVFEALNRLQEGGRLVAILGEGSEFGRPDAMKKLYTKLMRDYNLVADISVAQSDYNKFGTSFGNRIIVIDKTGRTEAGKPQLHKNFETISEALNGIQDVIDNAPRNLGVNQKSSSLDAEQQRSGTEQYDFFGQSADESGGSTTSSRGSGQGTAKQSSSKSNESKRSSTAKKPTNNGQSNRKDKPVSGNSPNDNIRIELALNKSGEKGEVETSGFVSYVPKYVSPLSQKHPAKLVETATMSAVPIPEITYQPLLPKEAIENGELSDAQIEAVALAGQRHDIILRDGKRAGFFLGDGTGIGKGRTLAGIILDNWNRGNKRSVWVSVSRDLIKDSREYLDAIGGSHIPIKVINDFNSKDGQKKLNDIPKDFKGVIFSTYNTIAFGGDEKARLNQLNNWLDEESVMIFDEAHKAKNFVVGQMGQPSKTAIRVVELQDELKPKAKVVYASATGASDINNMAYMTRLGLWGTGASFDNFSEFVVKMGTRGVGAMEMVSRDLKALGAYVSRFISYEGVEYTESHHELTKEQEEMYNTVSAFFRVALQNIDKALEETGGSRDQRKNVYGQFWGMQLRFYKKLVTAIKIPTLIENVEKHLENGRSVVVSLVGTSESATENAVREALQEGNSIDELDLSPRQALADMLGKYFPVAQYQEVETVSGKKERIPLLDGKGNPIENKRALKMKEELLESLNKINIPENPLDQFINYFELLAKNENDPSLRVAELTGRKKRISKELRKIGDKFEFSGKQKYSSRVPDDIKNKDINLWEMSNFQNGKKRIAIISAAASTGISLHADENVENQQQRVQIALELSWSADTQMQTFGRTHRLNQVFAPIFDLLSSNIGGEKRFSSSTAKKLASLGALSRGERDSSGSNQLAKYDIENDYGSAAVRSLVNEMDMESKGKSRDLLAEMGLVGYDAEGVRFIKKQATKLSTFMNRILILDVSEQNEYFDRLMQVYEEQVELAKSVGLFDFGAQDLKGVEIRVNGDPQTVASDELTNAETKYYEVEVDNKSKKVEYDTAKKYVDDNKIHWMNFVENSRSKRIYAIVGVSTVTDYKTGILVERYRLLGPNGSFSYKPSSDVVRNYERIDADSIAKTIWEKEYENIPEIYTETYHIIAGAVTPLWKKMDNALGVDGFLKVIKANPANSDRIVGVEISEDSIGPVLRALNVTRDIRTPEAMIKAVMDEGESLRLGDTFTLKQSYFQGDNALELRPFSSYVDATTKSRLKQMGVITEQVNWKDRFFIPTDQKKAEETLANILKVYPADETTGDERYQVAESEAEKTYPLLKDLEQSEVDRILKSVEKLLPKGYTLKFDENITNEKGGQVRGQINLKTKVITLNPKFANVTTIPHEINHGALSMLDEQKAGIVLRKNGWDGKGSVTDFSNDSLSKAFELVADRYAEWSLNREKFLKSNGSRIGRVYDRLFTKLKSFFEAISNWMKGEGLYSEAKFFDDLYSGEFSKMDDTIGFESKQALAQQASRDESFSDWFMNSKVANANGTPLVVYHGTTENFSQFRSGDIGYHFGTSYQANTRTLPMVKEGRTPMILRKDTPKGFKIVGATSEHANLMPVYLSLQNPLKIKDPKNGTAYDYYFSIIDGLKSQNPSLLFGESFSKKTAPLNDKDFSRMVEFLQSNGYDGLIYLNKVEGDQNSNSYIVFDPTQIKSVFNDGTFSPKNPDILNQSTDATSEDFEINPEITKDFTHIAVKANGKTYMATYGEKANTPMGAIYNHADLMEKYGLYSAKDVDTGFIDKDGNFVSQLFQKGKADTFYSKVEEVILQKVTGKSVNAKQLMRTLTNSGVKKEELDWLELEQYLRQNPKATRDELLAYIEQQNVKIDVVIKKSNGKATEAETVRMYELSRRYNDLNEIEIQEFRKLSALVYGDAETEYSGRTLPGGENYREVLLTIKNPNAKRDLKAQKIESDLQASQDELHDLYARVQETIGYNPQTMGSTEHQLFKLARLKTDRIRKLEAKRNITRTNAQWDTIQEEINAEYGKQAELNAELNALKAEIKSLSEEASEVGRKQDPYTSGHYSEPYILVHYRVDDRTGADGSKILAIQEIQSDWHEDGRKYGYKDATDTLEYEVRSGYAKAYGVPVEEMPLIRFARFMNNVVTKGGYGSESEIDKTYRKELSNKYSNSQLKQLSKVANSVTTVPNAPYKKSWHELAFKHILRYASENGYDAIALTTGDQQNDRYGLAKEVDSIEHKENADRTKHIKVNFPDGKNMQFIASKEGKILLGESFTQGKQLDEVLGKEKAKIIMGKKSGILVGLDLEIGGDGMRGFYDKMLPTYMNKLGKKHGSKVSLGLVNLPNPSDFQLDENKPLPTHEEIEAGGYEMHILPITDKLRSFSLSGVPLFQSKGRFIKDLSKGASVKELFTKELGNEKLASTVLFVYSKLEMAETRFNPIANNVHNTIERQDQYKEEHKRLLALYDHYYEPLSRYERANSDVYDLGIAGDIYTELSQQQHKKGREYLNEKIKEAFEKGESLLSYTGGNLFQSEIGNKLSVSFKQEVKKEFAKAKLLLPKGWEIEIDDTIVDESGNAVRGVIYAQSKTIKINPRIADKSTLPHELGHAGLVIAGADQAGPLLKLNGWDGKGDILNFGNNSLVKAHERIADKYSSWNIEREDFIKKQGKLGKIYDTVFQKLKQFFQSLSNMFKGNGYVSEAKFYWDLSNGKFANKEARIFAEPGYAYQKLKDAFFSKVERLISEKAPSRNIKPEQLKKMLVNNGAKQAELDWLDIGGFLEKNPKATKQELLDFVKENNVKIEIKELGSLSKNKRKEILRQNYKKVENKHPNGELTIEYWEKGVENEPRFTIDSNNGSFSVSDVYGGVYNLHETTSLSSAVEYVENDLTQNMGENQTKHSQYQLPGGENYREVLVTMPENPRNKIKVVDEYTGEIVAEFDRYVDASNYLDEHGRADRKIDSSQENANNYKSPHYNELNILVHFRVNDRTMDLETPQGKIENAKVLNLEENQSDHVADARKIRSKEVRRLVNDGMTIKEAEAKVPSDFGYKGISTKGWTANVGSKGIEADIYTVFDADGNRLAGSPIASSPEKAIKKQAEMIDEGKVPNHPFKDKYYETGIKQALRMAVVEGYNGISWTTGKQQTERWESELRKSVDAIHWSKDTDGKVKVDGIKNNSNVFSHKIPLEGSVKISSQDVSLDKLLGKKIATQVREDIANKKRQGYFEGDNLTIGGTGFENLYNKQMVQFLNKFGKKFGARVGEAALKTEPIEKKGSRYRVFGLDQNPNWFDTHKEASDFVKTEKGLSTDFVHTFPITDKMRASVLQGQPLFQRAESEPSLAMEDVAQLKYDRKAKRLYGYDKAGNLLFEKKAVSRNRLRKYVGSRLSNQLVEADVKRELTLTDKPIYGLVEISDKKGDVIGLAEKAVAEDLSPELQTVEVEEKKPTRLEKKVEQLEAKLPESKGIVRKKKRTIIKDEIRAIKRGHRLGTLDTKQQFRDVKNQINRYIRENLPKALYGKGDTTALVSKVAKAETIEDLEPAFSRIDGIIEKTLRKQGLTALSKAFKKYSPKKDQSGKLKGSSLTADEYQLLSNLKEIVLLPPEKVEDYIEAIYDRNTNVEDELADLSEEEIELVSFLQIFGSLKHKTSGEIFRAVEVIEDIIAGGREKRAAKEAQRKERMSKLRAGIFGAVTGGKGLPELDIASKNKPYDNKSLRNKLSEFDNYTESMGWLWDKLQKKDKNSRILKGPINEYFTPAIVESRNTENAGVRENQQLMIGKLTEIYGVTGNKLVKKLDSNTKLETVVLNLHGNETEVELSQNQLYKKYIELQDSTLDGTFEAMGYSDVTKQQIEDLLTDEVRAWADWQVNEFYPAYYESVNKVFRERFYVDLPYNPFYSPISRDVSKLRGDEQLLGSNKVYATIANGSLKSRVKNTKPLRYTDGDTTILRHIIEMEHFKAWSETMRELRSVMGNPDIRKAIRHYHGNSILKILEKMYDDLARGGVDRSNTLNRLDAIRSSFTKAVIGYNPTVFLKQLTSIPAFMFDISPKAFGAGVGNFMLHPKMASRTLSRSRMLQARYGKGWERDVMLALRKNVSKSMAGTKSFTDHVMILTKLGDKGAILVGGWAVYKYHYDKAIKNKMTLEEADKIAMAKFEESALRHQQSGETENLSYLQTMNSVSKLFTMFMTAPSQYYRYEVGALRNIRHGRGNLGENLKTLAISHFLLPVMFQYFASGLPGLLSDLDDEDIEKMKRAAIIGSYNGVLILGDYLEMGVGALFGELSYMQAIREGLPVLTPFSDILLALQEIGKKKKVSKYNQTHLIKKPDKGNEIDLWSVIDHLASGSSKLSIGVPYDPVKRIVIGTKDYITGESKEPARALGFSNSALGKKEEKKKYDFRKQ